MFVGHYAAAYALKGKEPTASLGMLFIATQFVDILFFPFVMLGIENMTFVEGFTEVNDFNMHYYPFTHGLLSSVLWAGLFYGLYYFFISKKNKAIAIVMALGVLSHWFVDLIVHTPDLPLIAGDPKFGFGLWNNKLLAFVVEGVLLIAGWWYFIKNTTAKSSKSFYINLAFVSLLLVINFLNFYILPASDDITQLTISALFFYFLLAGIAVWAERGRGARELL